LAADFPTRPEFRQDLATTQNNVGVLLRDLGRMQEAEAAFGEAVALQEQLAAGFPNRPEFRQDLAKTHNNLGNLFNATGRPKPAEAAYGAALALYQQLAADFPAQPEFRQELATGHNNLGVLLRDTGRRQGAEPAFAAALALQKQLAADFPNRPEFRQDLAKTHNNLGILLRDTGRRQEAEAAYVDALALRRQLAADFPARSEFRQDLARSHHNLGSLLRLTGRRQKAEAAYSAALALYQQLAADFPDQPDLRNGVAGACLGLALLRLAGDDFRGAKTYLTEAAPHHDSALKANPRHPVYRLDYRNNLRVLVQTNACLGDPAGAKQAAERLRDLGWDPPGNAYDAACSLAVCIRTVQRDDRVKQGERDKQAAFYGDAALMMLRDAVARGFKDTASLKQHADLAPLRTRDDFKKLIAELEGKAKP
jgi:tetratricopeptide (TPR) repeat protein